MDHDRKRQVRLVIALTVAVLLAVALIYTSFNAGTEAREPSDVLAQGPSNETYQLTGEVTDYKREGSDLEFALGYSHPVPVLAPEGISFEVQSPTKFVVKGIDKQKVGEVAANIRKLRKPDPYKGKGVRYEGEQIKLKVGKTGK